jgi:chloramphenicol 3-O phosphotransferase
VAGIGTIVVLNGAPRSGKTSIAKAMQASPSETWLNLGVDAFSDHVPGRLRPGIGLRPGGERPELEEHVPLLYDALCRSVVALSGLGFDVVVDVGLHEDYATPLGIVGRVARELASLPAYLVGVRCPVDVVMARRNADEPGRDRSYVRSGPGGAVPDPVLRWERAVHDPGVYDLEVDTSVRSPVECAAAIRARLGTGPPTAFEELARRRRPT